MLHDALARLHSHRVTDAYRSGFDEACRHPAVDAHGGVTKAGFGLGDDLRRITRKLCVEPAGVLELNSVFRAQGYRSEMGVKTAVALLFQRRFLKSKKAATSNWSAQQLSDAQLMYAANDAWAALRVYLALGLAASPGLKRA